MIKHFEEFMKDYVVQEKVEIETDKGDFKEVWQDKTTVRGVLSTASGQQKEIANSFDVETTHVLYTAYSSMIKNGDRIKDNNEVIFNIVYLDNVMNLDELLEIHLVYKGGVNNDFQV